MKVFVYGVDRAPKAQKLAHIDDFSRKLLFLKMKINF